MKRVGICSYWYPPNRTIASLRIAKFAKFLPEFGWDPYVFTVTPVTDRYMSAGALVDEAPQGHVHRIPDPSIHALVDRVTTARPAGASRASTPRSHRSTMLTSMAYRAYREAVCIPDETWPWLWRYSRVRDAVSSCGVDVLFSSSPPATVHLLARRLSRDLGTPWVADLRDPWSDMHTVDRSRWRKALDVSLERRTLRAASALTTVSSTMADRFREGYTQPVHVVMNGFDDDDVPVVTGVTPESDRLTFVYTGMLYDGRRTPLMVFQALRELSRRAAIDLRRVRVRLYGRNLDIAVRQLQDFPELAESVEIGGEVGYGESLLAQRRATVLLLLEWPDPRAAGVVTGKVFEYLATGRPIIATATRDGEIDRILAQTGAGVTASTVPELGEAIERVYNDFLAFGPPASRVGMGAAQQFSRRAQAGRLAHVLDSVVTGVSR